MRTESAPALAWTPADKEVWMVMESRRPGGVIRRAMDERTARKLMVSLPNPPLTVVREMVTAA